MRARTLAFTLLVILMPGPSPAEALEDPLCPQNSAWSVEGLILRTVDLSGGWTLDAAFLDVPGLDIQGAHGLALHPQTGQLYTFMDVLMVSGRHLIAVDPETGSGTDVGNTGDSFERLTFGRDGTLYAVTADDAGVPEALYLIDTTDGTPTLITPLGAGTQGEAIAFNPIDGLLYHVSGDGMPNVDEVLEVVDPSGSPIVPIPLSGDDFGGVSDVIHLTEDILLLVDEQDGRLFEVTTSGVVTEVGHLPLTSGLSLVGAPNAFRLHGPGLLTGPNPNQIWAITKGGRIERLNAHTGEFITHSTLSLGVSKCYGLSRHPQTGESYAIVPGDEIRRLVKVDLLTGDTVDIGGLGDRFSGLTFAADGTLYAVTGDGANTPETLYTVDLTDGTPTLLAPLGNGTDGEQIVYHPGEGLLYHASGIGTPNTAEILETVHPSGAPVVNVPLSGHNYDEILGMAVRDDGLLLVTDLARTLCTITTTGGVTKLGDVHDEFRGLAVNAMAVPLLRGCGAAVAGEEVFNELCLVDAPDAGTSLLIAGFSAIDAPFKGGVLGPSPDLLVAVPLTPTGDNLTLFEVPPGVPAGTEVWIQHWIVDAGAVFGWCASNTLELTTR